MRTKIIFNERARCFGFTIRKTPKGLFVTTAWGNQFYTYPKNNDYGFYLMEYLEYATR